MCVRVDRSQERLGLQLPLSFHWALFSIERKYGNGLVYTLAPWVPFERRVGRWEGGSFPNVKDSMRIMTWEYCCNLDRGPPKNDGFLLGLD